MIGLFFTLIIILVMSGILGLAFTLMGCVNTPNCIAYASFKKVSIIGHEVKEDRCDNCNPPRSSCRNYLKQCFHSYAIAEFKIDEQNKTCSILVAEAYGSTEEALKKAQSKYKQGKQYTFSVHKEKFTCETDSGTLRLAIAGFVFLGIFGLDALILIFICLLNKRAKKAANKPQNGNTNTTVISNSNARPQMPEAHETTQTPENDI